MENMTIADITDSDEGVLTILVPPEYKGPKAIGQIFGISYLYSMFWKWGLINVPERSCCLGFQFSPTEMLAKIEKHCRKTCGNMIK